jgi:hypothetical protein
MELIDEDRRGHGTGTPEKPKTKQEDDDDRQQTSMTAQQSLSRGVFIENDDIDLVWIKNLYNPDYLTSKNDVTAMSYRNALRLTGNC